MFLVKLLKDNKNCKQKCTYRINIFFYQVIVCNKNDRD